MSKLNLIMGARNGAKTEREENDFYATHPDTTRLFIEKIRKDNIQIGLDIWEPACGKGHMAEVLKEYGYNVYSTDLINRGYGNIQDFLSSKVENYNGTIITNPPFNLAKEFAYKGLNILCEGGYLCLLLKIQFLEGKERKKIFEKFPPKFIYIYSGRQQCSLNAEFDKYNAKTQAYIWIIWQKGYIGETITRWI